MLTTAPNSYAPHAAGKALMSVAWETKKLHKAGLSAKCRAASHWKKQVKLDPQIRKSGCAIAHGVDAAVDRFVERVEAIMRRRGGTAQILERIEELMPKDVPVNTPDV